MVDRKPNLDAYARVAYLRELRGDLDGAEEALRLAVSAGGEVPENTAFAQALLGDLELVRGRPARAVRAYDAALALVPDHTPSVFGIARARAAQGRLGDAIRRLQGLVDRLPSPAYATALGEAELAAGRREAAARDLGLVGAQARLLRSAGVSSDVEVALYEADHGSPRRAVEIARRVWREAPGVRSADALGWALTRAGRPSEGLRYALRPVRLGSREPSFLYHAGVAAARAGDGPLARRLLRRVVEQAPRFSPLHGPRAARELERVS
jgi:tetratricopeptide (TPR) repeat protein